MSTTTVLCTTVCMLIVLTIIEAQYTIPEVKIDIFKSEGLRAYIKHVPGIKLFGFHGKISPLMEPTNEIDFGGEIKNDTAGRWIYKNQNLKISIGETLNYWIEVQHNNLLYRRDNLQFEVKKLVAQNSLPPITSIGADTISMPGVPSITTINNGNPTTKRALIFKDNFKAKTLDFSKWTPEVRFPADDMEAEFVTYRNTAQNIEISNGKLKITPTFSRGNDEEFTVQMLDLGAECTTSNKKYCRRAPSSYDIISPITSGKVTTKDHFSFKYGKIEIRAKLPRGDWIFPILYLEPKLTKHGDEGYASGLIRIAFSRGNNNLFYNEQLGNRILSGGLLMGRSETCRAQGTKSKEIDGSESWGNDFHNYGLIWNNDSITLTVDGFEYGSISPPEGGFRTLSACSAADSTMWTQSMAPFDEEFYISLGVGVGGVADFPDVSGKPWKNKRPQGLLDFWTKREEVYSGWNDDQISLLVDSVNVWAA